MPSTKISEIDEIFASKPTAELAAASLSSLRAKGKAKALSGGFAEVISKKRKKKKKEQTLPDPKCPEDKVPPFLNAKLKKPEPETVFDPSAKQPRHARKDSSTRTENAKKRKMDDEERFRDSRGISSRRKTEEGFAIYKEDELGIRDEGGDTPLCPFDCDCCF